MNKNARDREVLYLQNVQHLDRRKPVFFRSPYSKILTGVSTYEKSTAPILMKGSLVQTFKSKT